MQTLDNLSELVASGRTADIYALDDRRVVKLFQSWVPRWAVEREMHNTSVVHAMGLAVPNVWGEVRHDDRYGFILERIRGEMMQSVLRIENVAPMARELARLHLELHHQQRPVSLPAQRDILRERISAVACLSDGERRALLDRLAAMPACETLCHGDLHPRNIMLTDTGPVIIDWIDATCGHPIADVARTSLLFLRAIALDDVSDAVRAAMIEHHDTYLAEYLQGASRERCEVQRWLPIMAGARLWEGMPEQEAWLVGLVRQGLDEIGA